MEEQKFPSRSERHKKGKRSLFAKSKPDKQIEEAIETEQKPVVPEASQTTKQHEHLAWYFSDVPDLPVEPEAEAETARATEREVVQEQQEEPATEKVPVVKKHKKHRNLNPAAGFLLLFFMLCSGALCGYAAMNAILPSNSVWGDDVDQEMLNNINILVLGCDEREGDSAARSDVIMLATIRPDAKQVSVFSIPRDTRVEIAGHGEDKINHAMAYGGIPLIQDTVENLLNIQIDHYVKVNFDGFINVIDALGGVNIDVPCRMYKPLEAIDLQAGYQTLDGSEALAFVRWRGDGTGDYGRIERQQQFLAAVTEKVKSMSLKQALDVVSAVMDSITTDMSVKQMTSYGINLLGINSESVKTYSFIGESVYIKGVNYVEPDMDAINDIVDKMQHGEPEPEQEPEAEGDETAEPAAV
jgi:LCP family protein required for cell wall assembly